MSLKLRLSWPLHGGHHTPEVKRSGQGSPVWVAGRTRCVQVAYVLEAPAQEKHAFLPPVLHDGEVGVLVWQIAEQRGFLGCAC